MNLFVQKREYQRSIDRMFEDFSGQRKTSNDITSRIGDESKCLQYNAKAWREFLDRKRKA